MELHSITLKDKEKFDYYSNLENSRSTDYNFPCIYIWDAKYNQKLFYLDKRVIINFSDASEASFIFPVGDGDIKEAIDLMLEFAKVNNNKLHIYCVEEKHKQLLEENYPDKFEFIEQESSFDYVYLAEKLSTYSGKSLQAKRNFCNRFENNYDWSFEVINKDILDVCLNLVNMWENNNTEKSEVGANDEYITIKRAFDNYEYLDILGGILYANNQPVAFSMGNKVNSDTFLVHFEKADTNVVGSYPMVCREMTKLVMNKYPEIKYMNREDDSGLEYLRKSKLSYKPEFLIKKYLAVEK